MIFLVTGLQGHFNMKPFSIPSETTAAILFESGQPLAVKQVTLPELIEGQVLIEIHYSGVCRSQLMEVRGFRGHDKWLPHLLGHEAVGVVLQTHPSVKRCKIGDKVVLSWLKGEGINAKPASYKLGDKTINGGHVTTFSSHSVISENRVTKIPDAMNFKQALLLGCALPTGMGVVINEAKPDLSHE